MTQDETYNELLAPAEAFDKLTANSTFIDQYYGLLTVCNKTTYSVDSIDVMNKTIGLSYLLWTERYKNGIIHNIHYYNNEIIEEKNINIDYDEIIKNLKIGDKYQYKTNSKLVYRIKFILRHYMIVDRDTPTSGGNLGEHEISLLNFKIYLKKNIIELINKTNTNEISTENIEKPNGKIIGRATISSRRQQISIGSRSQGNPTRAFTPTTKIGYSKIKGEVIFG